MRGREGVKHVRGKRGEQRMCEVGAEDVSPPHTSTTLPLTHPPLSLPQGIGLKESEEKLLTILKQVMEEKLTSTNVEVRSLPHH